MNPNKLNVDVQRYYKKKRNRNDFWAFWAAFGDGIATVLRKKPVDFPPETLDIITDMVEENEPEVKSGFMDALEEYASALYAYHTYEPEYSEMELVFDEDGRGSSDADEADRAMRDAIEDAAAELLDFVDGMNDRDYVPF